MEMKEYMAPEMEVIEVKMQGILCNSIEEDPQPGWGGGAGGKDPD